MKSILKKVAGLAIAAVLAFGMAGCSEDSSNDSSSHEHTFGEWTVTLKPTVDAEGTQERECLVCGYKATESIAKLDHVHAKGTLHAAVAGTCQTKGTIAYYDCTKEGCEVKLDEDGNPLASIEGELGEHTWNDGVVTREPTAEAEGVKTYTCTRCEQTKTEAVEWLGFVEVVGVTITGTETWTPRSEVFVSERQLTIPSLVVCDHEVTRGEFKEVMGTDPSTAEAYNASGTKLTGDYVLKNPVNYVNWYDAIAYCNKLSINEGLTPCYTVSGVTDWATLAYSSIPTSKDSNWDNATCNFEANGYRLPTVAEWEWLARGGEEYTYAGSDNVSNVAWFHTIGSMEVKTKQKNGYGLYDMSGNVWEWCWDWAGIISSTTADTGAASGSNRVKSGGSWKFYDYGCKVTYNVSLSPDSRCNDLGFRVVRTAE